MVPALSMLLTTSLLLAAVASAMPHQAAEISSSAAGSMSLDFEAYMSRHGRSYRQGTPEYAKRRDLFHRRLEEASEQNGRPGRLWTAGINHFSDRTVEELNMVKGWRRGPRVSAAADLAGTSRLLELEARDAVAAPEAIDWRNLSMAYNVYDQGHCGSCWAVATVAVLEAHHEIAHGTSRTFSAQELISCVKNPHHCGGKGGCDGATVELGLKWALDSGLANIDEEPYEGQDMACKKRKSGSVSIFKDDEGQMDKDGRIMTDAEWQAGLENREHANEAKGHAFGLLGFQTLVSNKEAPLVRALAEQGPVAIAVAANGWFPYESGIFDNCRQDWVVNHAVTLFGYGKTTSGSADQRYWLIRNSWGPSWGERGFIRMVRTKDEDSQCGQDTSPSEGVACDGGPAEVNVCGSCGILYDSVVPKIHKTSLASAPKPDPKPAPAPASAEDSGDVGSHEPDPDEMRVLRAAPEVTARPLAAAATLPRGHALAASAAEQRAAGEADELDAEARNIASPAAANLHRRSISPEADVTTSGPRASSQRRGPLNAAEKLLRREVAF